MQGITIKKDETGKNARDWSQMRRAYLLSTCKFPRGSASANYLQYLGMAFSEMGYEVILVSYGNKALCEYSNGKYKYKDIEFRPIEYSNEIEKKVIDKYFLGEKIIGLIKKKELSSDLYLDGIIEKQKGERW